MSKASVLSHEWLSPGILLLQCDIPWNASLIDMIKKDEYKRDYKVIHSNTNTKWHKRSGVDYHITYLDQSNPFHLHYDKKIAQIFTESLAIYNQPFKAPGCIINKDYGYNILHYITGGDYPWHFDGYGSNTEVVGGMNLNSNFEGGIFEFNQFPIKITPKTGQLLLFPSGVTYEHRSTRIVSGDKFVLRARLGIK